GRIARYAWGNDYHDLVRAKLNKLAEYLVAAAPGAIARGVVDTAPLLEREYAQLAGLGWIGKNTLLLNRSEGSWFFLAALLTDQSLDYDEPHAADHCGSCRACLDACPTDAFVRPYVHDARRCVSYLTIEHRTAIPEALRGGIGNWVLGCDICQDVCPWNRKSPATDEPALAPNEQSNPIELAELFALDDRAFRQRFGGTPLWRPKRRGILRNAAIVLGNQRDPNAVPALIRGLADPEPLVRGACAWALGRFNSTMASTALERRRPIETDDLVRAEIDLVLRAHARATSQG
ncbi:MAG TPA: tRNA epoxyqueuosine(34) reductase QueG, partial [Pirellulales bacterium]|nr:tRNA epoxyqueuosine(34) reductase QueG [Pirellulales bacterium]